MFSTTTLETKVTALISAAILAAFLASVVL
jgi:hypothetical protein